MTDRYDEDSEPFQRLRKSAKHGKGSAMAANKGKVKRLRRDERRTYSKRKWGGK
jgi:hypothetical protein